MPSSSASAALHAPLRPLPGEGRPLAVKSRIQRGIGATVHGAGDAGLIAGVHLAPGVVWPDDRGFFTELFRLGEAGVAQEFGAGSQVSAALTYAGVIKAVHYHRHQTDLWIPLRGGFQMALFDLRLDSPTFGEVNTIFGGDWRPLRISIPPGVGHGYKVLGPEPGLMVYATDRHYDPTDEGRIPFDDAGLNYAWETQFR